MNPKKKTMIFLTSQAVTLFGSTLVQMAIVPICDTEKNREV